jgi:hypothetical protein
MKKLKLFALTVAALIGVTGVANAASATMLAQDDFVGISFWIISMGMLAEINKVANQRSKLQELLKLDYREPLFNDVDNNIPNQSNKEAVPVIQVPNPEKPISTQILNKPDADERDLGLLPELKSNPFLRTLGIHGSEHEAQGLAHVNDTLLPNEIQLIEEAIFEDSHGDLDLEKIKLAWALMLYYSIPINAINFILIPQKRE